MANSKFGVNVPLPTGAVISTALGTTTSVFTDKDQSKAVKLSDDSTYGLVADGDVIEGIVESLEPHTVNDGYAFGSVLRHTPGARAEAEVDSGTLVVGDVVVAAAQKAVGTAQSNVLVKKAAGTETTFLWRVVSLPSGGAAGDVVIIEAY